MYGLGNVCLESFRALILKILSVAELIFILIIVAVGMCARLTEYLFCHCHVFYVDNWQLHFLSQQP